MTNPSQPGILAPLPPSGRFLTLGLAPGADVGGLAMRLEAIDNDDMVIGLGDAFCRALRRQVEGLRPFPALHGAAFPSTQGALWAAVRGDDPGGALLRARAFVAELGNDVVLDEDVPSFVHAGGRDLTGYEDGTENPKDERAAEVALIAGAGEGLDGGSFVAVQRWVHDLHRFGRFPREEQDRLIGRARDSNEELADAPASAHVKRSAQESFDPPAFMLRRSMPWGDLGSHGLYFVAYGATLDPFERVLRRMAGLDDGITDGLLRFSRPATGGYYFCPPLRDGRLDLRALGF